MKCGSLGCKQDNDTWTFGEMLFPRDIIHVVLPLALNNCILKLFIQLFTIFQLLREDYWYHQLQSWMYIFFFQFHQFLPPIFEALFLSEYAFTIYLPGKLLVIMKSPFLLLVIFFILNSIINMCLRYLSPSFTINQT